MQRSHMLLKIQEILVEQHEDMTLEEAADDILTRLEQAGMAPPYSDQVFQKEARIYINATGRKWEPEDV
jgi:hypothetical protein